MVKSGETNTAANNAFVKAWLTSRTCTVVIFIIFCLSRHFAIEHL